MNKILIVLSIILSTTISCSQAKDYVGTRQTTQNPNTPYIYKNGFKDYTVINLMTVNASDTSYVNELRFNSTYSAMYIKKVMYDKFGRWHKAIHPQDQRHPVLIWENIKLFETNDQLFTIAATGVESREEIYASVMVFDSANKDCLTEMSSIKSEIIELFSQGIQNLNDDRTFYDVYWKIVD